MTPLNFRPQILTILWLRISVGLIPCRVLLSSERLGKSNSSIDVANLMEKCIRIYYLCVPCRYDIRQAQPQLAIRVFLHIHNQSSQSWPSNFVFIIEYTMFVIFSGWPRIIERCYGVHSTQRCRLSTLGAMHDVKKKQWTHEAAADIFLTVIDCSF
jgi:hypothetical protein